MHSRTKVLSSWSIENYGNIEQIVDRCKLTRIKFVFYDARVLRRNGKLTVMWFRKIYGLSPVPQQFSKYSLQ